MKQTNYSPLTGATSSDAVRASGKHGRKLRSLARAAMSRGHYSEVIRLAGRDTTGRSGGEALDGAAELFGYMFGAAWDASEVSL